MRLSFSVAVGSIAAVLSLVAPTARAGQVDVLTHHYNNYRTGSNTNETVLDTTINSHNFGALFSIPVDGQLYAQPLVVCGLNFGSKGLHDVVYLCTANDYVYAYDADRPSSQPLWARNLGTPIPYADTQNNNITPNVGIISTPVIDKAAGTMFVVSSDVVGSKALRVYSLKLHALDLITGKEKAYSPIHFEATIPGTGQGGNGFEITFNPLRQMNRPALLLDHGRLYVAFGSHGDEQPYHGWVFALDETTLRVLGLYCDTANGIQGGIWQSGNGPVADDAGNVYVLSGNGDFTPDLSGDMTGNSFVKLTLDVLGLNVSDYFTPYQSAWENGYDLDLGAGGPVMIPNTPYLFGAGKDGYLYLVDSNRMGRFNSVEDDCTQAFHTFPGEIHSSAFWVSPYHGPVAYFWPENSNLRQYRFLKTKFSEKIAMESTIVDKVGDPGGILSVSSNGTQPGTGLVWATLPISESPDSQSVPGILYAFDADDLDKVLWTSEQNHDRDSLGLFAKFTPPVVANGKVYMATFSNKLMVYGRLNAAIAGR